MAADAGYSQPICRVVLGSCSIIAALAIMSASAPVGSVGMEEVLALVTEDDSIRSAIRHLYAALCGAALSKIVLEDHYSGKYLRSGRGSP